MYIFFKKKKKKNSLECWYPWYGRQRSFTTLENVILYKPFKAWPPFFASWAPVSLRSASNQPQKRFSWFQQLSPWRMRTSLYAAIWGFHRQILKLAAEDSTMTELWSKRLLCSVKRTVKKTLLSSESRMNDVSDLPISTLHQSTPRNDAPHCETATRNGKKPWPSCNECLCIFYIYPPPAFCSSKYISQNKKDYIIFNRS